jgi:hypothetical protein
MSIILKAQGQILDPNYKIVRAQFDVEPAVEHFGEYVLTNLVRERGLIHDGKLYRITIEPLFPHNTGE